MASRIGSAGITVLSGAKKITILLPNLGGGGAERLHINLAKNWRDQGYAVDFVLMRASGELLPIVPCGVGVIELGANRIRAVIPKLRRYLRKARPDVLLVAMWPLTSVATLAWMLAGRIGRLFLSDHTQLNISVVREMGTFSWVLRCCIAMTYPRACGIIAVSQGVKQSLCALGRLAPRRIEVINNPVAIDASNHAEDSGLRQRLWGREDGFKILAAGTLKPQKDHATLLRAFAKLPHSLDVTLVVLGEGPLRRELLKLRDDLGLRSRVHFPGFVLDPERWYRSADLFVLSSGWEGFANVIVEAMSFGLPIVSTNCQSGPSEILEGGRYGTLVPLGDVQALSNAMAAALRHPGDREARIARSRDFSVDLIGTRYLEYFGLVNRRGGSEEVSAT